MIPPPPPDDTPERLARLLRAADDALGEHRVEIRRPIRLAERAIRLRAIALTVSAVALAVALTAGAAVARDRIVNQEDGTESPSVTTSTPTSEAPTSESPTGTTTQTPPPTVTITPGPIDPTNSTTATFELTVDPPGSSTSCLLDDAPVPCESGEPVELSEIGEGTHEFEARAVDEQGTAGPADSYSWTVDLTPPTVQLSSALLVYGGGSTDPGCSVDGQPWNCSDPVTGLSGPHRFGVLLPGGFDGTALTWTLDATPPSVVFVNEGDPTSSVTSQIKLAFALSDGTATCSANGAALPCADGLLVDQLTSADQQTVRHALAIVSTDPAGNVGAPAQLLWSFANTNVVG